MNKSLKKFESFKVDGKEQVGGSSLYNTCMSLCTQACTQGYFGPGANCYSHCHPPCSQYL